MQLALDFGEPSVSSSLSLFRLPRLLAEPLASADYKIQKRQVLPRVPLDAHVNEQKRTRILFLQKDSEQS